MQWYEILFLALYGCLLSALILLKAFKVGNRRRGVVKMLLSCAFVAAGIFGCVKSGGLDVVLAVALVFAAVGDLFLVFMDKRSMFIAGILSFSGASLLLSVYSVLQYGWYWWSAVIFVVVAAVGALGQIFGVYSFGSCKVYLNIYTLLVSVCGCLGLSLLCQGTANLPAFLFGLGCFLYYASDMCLGLYMFKFRNRTIDAINSLFYFPAMLLVAISLLV